MGSDGHLLCASTFRAPLVPQSLPYRARFWSILDGAGASRQASAGREDERTGQISRGSARASNNASRYWLRAGGGPDPYLVTPSSCRVPWRSGAGGGRFDSPCGDGYSAHGASALLRVELDGDAGSPPRRASARSPRRVGSPPPHACRVGHAPERSGRPESISASRQRFEPSASVIHVGARLKLRLPVR